MTKRAIYLAGGGARGAYQVGVLKAIHHILLTPKLPFEIVSGVSVGTVNAMILAQLADNFSEAIEKLEYLWQTVRCQKVYNAGNYFLGKSLLRNLIQIIIRQRNAGYLLDTAPLHAFIKQHIDFDKVTQNINNNQIEFLEIITNCYELQKTVSFYYTANKDFKPWISPRHDSQLAPICFKHILSSTALPLFFPSVNIQDYHYGDGSMGLVSPLRGCVRFAAQKILILGTRHVPQFVATSLANTKDIGFARILGNMLDSLFLDNLDRDIELVNRMNEITQLLSLWKKRRSPWRPIETLHLRPSMDVSMIAQEQYHTMPKLLRFLLNMLGAQDYSGDLLSFLLFETPFTQRLIDLGYQDTLAKAGSVEAFFK